MTIDPAQPVPPAILTLRDGQPFSQPFDDVYYQGDGVAETERVFIALNDLDARFAGLRPGNDFTVGEIGFGTGLNLLVTSNHFLASAQRGSHLHFISCERQPFTRADFLALPRPAALVPLARELADHLPPRLPGWHRRWLAGGRIQLSLFYGNATAALQQLPAASIDAWFLDGFAPDRNADAWSAELFHQLGRASHQGSSAATFSVARRVRRALEDAGFTTERVDGRPHKRHYLRASNRPSAAPRRTRPTSMVIAGAGLAGAWIALALARRGLDVQLYGGAAAAPPAPSTNPWAVLHARLSTRNPALAALRLQALAAATDALSDEAPAAFHPIGVLQGPGPAVTIDDLAATASWLKEAWPHGQLLSPAAASSRANVPMTTEALWYPRSGWADLAQLTAELTRHPGIEHRTGPAPSADVIASGLGAPLRLQPLAGSTGFYPAQGVVPRTVISGAGFLIPVVGGVVSGATYERTNQGPPDNADRIRNWLGWQPDRRIGGWYGTRATTPDRLPYVGPVDNHRWVSAGFGSTGLAFTPLAAEIIASSICQEPPPTSLTALLNPQRLAHR